MTSHPSVGELQSFLDGEGAFEGREHIDRHLGSCDRCGRELDDLRTVAGITARALSVLDVPVPDGAAVRWRARGTRASRRTGGLRRVAAVVVSIAAVGVAGWAVAMPGSPLRSFWRQDSVVEPASPSPAPPARTEVRTATVGLPAEGIVRIVFVGVPAGSELIVAEAAAGSPATATAPEQAVFSTSESRIAVDLGASNGPLRVALPPGADAVVTVNDQVILDRSDGAEEFPGPEPARSDDGLRFLVGSP